MFEKTVLEEVVLPSTLREIRFRIFSNCTRLRTVTLPGNIGYVGLWTFSGSALEDIIIPRSVTTIGAYAFSECTELKSVYFEPGSQLRLIECGAFEKTGLSEFVAPSSLREL